jgi:pimeloyl-ACP methyl ester carboxylesterase
LRPGHMRYDFDQPTSERVRVGDVTLDVQDWGGRGDLAVFAHATGFLGAVWAPVIGRLRRAGFSDRIITYDQRGHGLSSKPDSGYQWSRFVTDAISLMNALEVEEAVGIGHSAGATTLACSAARDRRLFRRLVMIDPILFEPDFQPVFGSTDNVMAARTRTRRLVWASRDEIYASYRNREPYDTWTDEALRAYVDRGTFNRPDGEVELLCPGRIEAQVYENSASIDGFAHLRELDVPVVLVRGGRSGSFDAERATRALGCLRHGRLVTIDDATHFVPMERPDEVADLVLGELRA